MLEKLQTTSEPTLLERFHQTRDTTRELLNGLTAEDCQIQSMADVSPLKWHLAHTTWFFETFLLRDLPDFRPYHPQYEFLFNSYYNAVGKQFSRAERGVLSRPSLDEILLYRQHVQEQIDLAHRREQLEDKAYVLELGIHHEHQHQELMLMDIKHVFASNPLGPAYRNTPAVEGEVIDLSWKAFDRTVAKVGHSGSGFGFDNEFPRHEAIVLPFQIANRLITNAEYREFIDDDGYRRPQLWLSDGWTWVQEEGVQAPLYWDQDKEFTLAGRRDRHPDAPVAHVSYYEADAFARWAGDRLPTEQEWEVAAADSSAAQGNFVDDGLLQPTPKRHDDAPSQMLGDVWEWTQSAYSAYPGYTPGAGALGEYNGKFMSNQMVLRGGSCVTPRDHIRVSYRNFFPPHARWQFGGIRLARDASS